MSLTVDQLLGADSSSDDEGGDAAGSQKKAQPGPGPGPDTSSQTAPPAQRPVLTVEQALAQGDLSDDDDEQEAGPRSCAPVPEDAQHAGAGAAATEDDELSDTSCDHTQDARNLVGLDEILAMGSDSSDDNLDGPPVRPNAEISPEKKQGGAVRTEGGGPSRNCKQVVQSTEAVSNGDDLEVFMRAPFTWCLEHERALLLANAEELSGGTAEQQGETRAEHNLSVGSTGGGAEAMASLSMVETNPCLELRRMLAQELGLPTCVATHAKFVGVGSLRGAVVLLDPKIRDIPSQPQVLCPPTAEEAVAVTALTFSPDGSSMLVGHKNGQLVLWDLTTQKVASIVKDVHSCAVLSVAFCRPSWQYALSADASGSVFLLTFTNTFGRRDCTRQLLLEKSSNIGITLRILPLPPVPHQVGHPADTQCLVALCATNATVLMTLHPTAKLLQKMQYHSKDVAAQAAWVPDVAWLRLEMREWIDATQVQSSDPQLCIAFGQTLHLMRVGFEKDPAKQKEEFKISLLHRYTWGSPIQSIVAFNESVLAILDSSNKLSVVPLPSSPEDPKPTATGPKEQLAAVNSEDVSGWSLAYHTYTSLDGSKDSRCHHGALAIFRGNSRTLYICGMKEVWNLQIGRWGQYIEELVSRNEWSTALDLFLSLHKGSLPPLLDFPQAVIPRQKAVESCTTRVVQSYLVSRLKQAPGREHVKKMCHTAVSVCIDMGLWSVLYKNVFASFKDAGHIHIYCNTLEPFIVKGRIPRDHMDSEVLSSILQSYAHRLEDEEKAAVDQAAALPTSPAFVDCDHCQGLFPAARRLQQLVLYVDVSQLDLNLAIRLFTRHRLWTALVHVYCALGDYISPLELLVGECVQLVKTGLARQKEGCLQEEGPLLQCFLVRKLFFFLQRCFELKAFLLDVSTDDSVGTMCPGPNAVAELLQCIFRPSANTPTDGSTKAPPLFLRLLRLSPLGFFSSLAVLFTSPAAGSAVQGQSCVLGATRQPLTPNSLFRTIEAAVEASRFQVDEEQQSLPPSTDSEFLWFKARAVPKAQLDLPTGHCMQVAEHLLAAPPLQAQRTAAPGFGCHSAEEAQQLLIGVFAAQESLGQERRDAFINKAMQKGFFEVASWLHEKHGEYDRVLDCRMQDDELRAGIFEYIISRLAAESGEKDGSNAAALVEATLQRLQLLVAVDAERCAVMICDQFASIADHAGVLNRLRGQPQMELQYLETLLVRRRRGHWKSTQEQQGFFDANVVRYIELLCSIAPSSVLPFITENETLPLRECLALCRKYAVTDASVHLLERTGDFPVVLYLLLGDYDRALEQLRKFFVENNKAAQKVLKRRGASAKVQGVYSKPDQEAPWWDSLQDAQRCVDIIEHAYELSARNSNIMTDAQLEELWFGVLERTVRLQERERSTGGETSKRWQAALAIALAELASQAMAGVLAYLSLPRSLNWICDKFGASPLGIWKDPLQSMLSGLSFQQGLLCAAGAVAAQDVVKPFMAVKRRGSRGVRCCPGSCTPGPGGELKVFLAAPRAGSATSAGTTSLPTGTK